MKFNIPCATVARLARASRLPGEPDPTHPIYTAQQLLSLRSLRLEHRNGMTFLMACNSKVFAIELIDTTNEPNGFVHIINDRELLDMVDAGVTAELPLVIDAQPGWTLAQVGTQFLTKSASVETDYPFDWGLFFVNADPDHSRGAFAFDAASLARLGSSSPSGYFVLPKVIDHLNYIVVNDIHDPDWMGVIMSTKDDNGSRPKPAIVRSWAKFGVEDTK